MALKNLGRIDQGGFGNVDRVSDEHGGIFACKTFARNQPLNDDLLANVLKRFRKEAKIQGSLSHRNIVPILGGDLDADPPYYLMPVAISSLARDIQSDRRLGGNFMSALSDIVAGLEELHSMQIFHRDLKPQNVLKFEDANGPFYAISDFGLISQKDTQLSVLTKTGMARSSDYYTAPEVTKDLRLATAQSDIFSLGCVLHDMVGTKDRVPCAEIREDGEFAAILLGCTRSDPKQRFKSAKSVLDAIVSVGSSGPLPQSQQSSDFVSALDSGDPLSEEFWRALAEFIDDKATNNDISAIMLKITDERIVELCATSSSAASQIAILFASWVQSRSFSFGYCDGLANRLEEFINHCNFEAKCECLMALLELGTSHNRWYVEWKFYRSCGPSMDENLAKRFAVQLRIAGANVCNTIEHLERSIGVRRDGLHPNLAAALSEICK